MKILVTRFASLKDRTLGALSIDGVFSVFTLEDAIRAVKISGVTAIPTGTYPLSLRTGGSMSPIYAKRYDNHQGMIWLQNVPNFEYVYIHVGNSPQDTEGCLLVGLTVKAPEGYLMQSRDAYEDIYWNIASAIKGEGASITIE